MPPADELRVLVRAGCRVLGAEGHGDLIWGHVSARAEEPGTAWMKASGWGFAEMEVDRVLRVDRTGRRVEGDGRVHVEFPIHTEILAARSDVGSVVHTHAPHAVAFAATEEPLRPVSHEGCLFVPPDIARFTDTADLVRTPALGAAVAEALGPRNAVLLVHHGIVTVGPDVATAVLTAILLERACRTQLLAMSAGRAYTWSPDDEAIAKREHCYGAALLQGAWEHLVRQLN
jgi:ribulose-5-phosphate 4-epimerase/fuculose-1-phosphate aldolase